MTDLERWPNSHWRRIYWDDGHGNKVAIGHIHELTGEITPPWHFVDLLEIVEAAQP